MPPEFEAGQDAPAVDSEATQTASATTPAETLPTDTQIEGQDEKEPAVERTYTETEFQERIERATAKASAKAERRAYREALQTIGRPAEQYQHQEQPAEPAARHESESDAVYVKRLVDAGMAERDNQARQHNEQSQRRATAQKTDAIYAEAAKTPGFDAEDFDSLPLTNTIAQTITESDVAAKLMVFMAANPDEVERISKLSPARQAAEIGKMEIKVSTAKPPKVSNAPEPIETIGSRGGVVKSLANASVDEVAEMMRKNGSRWVR